MDRIGLQIAISMLACVLSRTNSSPLWKQYEDMKYFSRMSVSCSKDQACLWNGLSPSRSFNGDDKISNSHDSLTLRRKNSGEARCSKVSKLTMTSYRLFQLSLSRSTTRFPIQIGRASC